MSYDYSENILVQESAGNLLRDELGWDVRFAYNTEILGKNGTFGRESYKEIVLFRYFREALKKLNPWINDSQISEAQKNLEQRLSTSSLLQVNEEKYFLIRDGIPVTVKKPNGKTEEKKAIVKYCISGKKNEKICITKYLAYSSNLDMEKENLYDFLTGVLKEAQDKTFDTLFEEQKAYMESFWDSADVQVEGDDALQQGIRFNLFHIM